MGSAPLLMNTAGVQDANALVQQAGSVLSVPYPQSSTPLFAVVPPEDSEKEALIPGLYAIREASVMPVPYALARSTGEKLFAIQ